MAPFRRILRRLVPICVFLVKRYRLRLLILLPSASQCFLSDSRGEYTELVAKKPWPVLVGEYTSLAFLLPCCVVVGWVIGTMLDKAFGTHWLYIVFLILGIAGGLIQLVRQFTRDSNDDSQR